MERPQKVSQDVVGGFLASHQGWRAEGDHLEKSYAFPYYGAGIAFAVHVGFVAEKKDHHPDLHISWGKVLVRWTTHDAGGITALDLEMAELTDRAYPA